MQIRQHDSRAAQWSLFEFPGKDSHCKEAKYRADNFGDQFIQFVLAYTLVDRTDTKVRTSLDSMVGDMNTSNHLSESRVCHKFYVPCKMHSQNNFSHA